MPKKWCFADFEFAVDSAWSAFENTLRTHGVTDKEVQKFIQMNDTKDNYNEVASVLAEVITWEEE